MSELPIPPAWADPVLRALIPRDRADDVTGDLLETFRDTPQLRRSTLAGELWYGRQVVGLFVRAYWFFPLILAATFAANDVSNTFRAVNGAPRMPDVLGVAIVSVFLAAGFWGGWRTRRVVGGIAAATGTHALTWAWMTAWWTVTTYPFALSQQSQPYWIEAWRSSSQHGESFLHWIVFDNVGAVILGGSMLLLVSLMLGAIGGGAATGLRRVRRSTQTA